MKHFYPILNYRYINHLPTIFSTECDIDMLLDLDEALAGRIIESCGTNITVFKGREYNYRLRNLKNLQQNMDINTITIHTIALKLTRIRL